MKAPTSTLIMLAIMALGCRGLGTEQPTRSATSGETPAVTPVARDGKLVGDVEQLVERLARADQFSGVVLLSHRGGPLFRRAYGLADRAARRPNTDETPFALASVSKMFTAVLVAQLVEQGKVGVDSTIGSLLPDFPAGQAKSQVNVHHLLTMSSGIPDVWRLPRFWEVLPKARMLPDFWSVFAAAPLEFTPGARWAYSNSNFLVLGAVVERWFGEPFATAAERQIFQVAGMTQTSYSETLSLRPARGYTRVRPDSAPATQPDPDGWYPAWEDEAPDASAIVPPNAPMGGGYSTVDDLARFADALMQARLLNRRTTERLMTGYVPADYGGRHGYGLETRLLNEVRVLGHQGGAPGVSNQVDFYPDLGYVLVVLGNSDASGAQEIANRVRAVIAGSAKSAEPR